MACEKAPPQMLLNLPAKGAPPRLHLIQFQAMVAQASQFLFHDGDHKSNGRITNGLVDRVENRACSLRHQADTI
eukprot:731551-Pleurochrysis_carterae.AAC.6